MHSHAKPWTVRGAVSILGAQQGARPWPERRAWLLGTAVSKLARSHCFYLL